MDLRADEAFGCLIRLAARMLSAPYAGISLVDCRGEWCVAQNAGEVWEIDRENSFSAQVVSSGAPCTFENGQHDLFVRSPLVQAVPGLTFWAGVPIRDGSRRYIGAFWIASTDRIELDAEHFSSLGEFADLAGDAIEWHRLKQEAAAGTVEEKNRYRAVIAGLPEAVFRVRRDTTVLDVHAPDPNVLVSEAGEIIGTRMQEHLEPSVAELLSRTLCDTLDTGIQRQVEYQIYSRAGDLRTLEARVAPLSDDEAIFIVRDITTRKKAEENLKLIQRELENSEARWQTLVENHPDPIIVSIEGKIIYANLATANFLGASRGEELMDLSFFDVVPGVYHEGLSARLEAVRKGENVRMAEYPIRTLRGEVRYVEAMSTSVVYGDQPALLTVARDVTERKRIEQALRQSKEFLSSIIDALSAHIAVLDVDGTILNTNAAWRQFAETNGGVEAELGVGANYLHACDRAEGESSEGASVVRAALRKLISGDLNSFELEYPCHSPDERRWFNVHASRFVSDGEVRVVVAHENITARMRAAEALEERETAHRVLLEAIPDMVVRVDASGRILDARIPPDFPFAPIPVRAFVQEVLPGSYSTILMEYIEECLATGRVQEWTIATMQEDQPGGFEVRFIPHGKDEVLVMVRNVSQERRLESQVLEAVALEQRRIGQDLHDGLGQQLVGLHYMSSTLLTQLGDTPEQTRAIAERVREGINQAIDEARTLSHGLNPVELEKEGLVYTLRELVQGTESVFGITCRLSVQGDVQIVNSSVAYHLYRITQEAVNNAVKHAAPSVIEIELVETQEMRVLSIRDDGRGFLAEVPRKGMGVHTMHYRANLIGASLHIRSKPGEGTIVTCQIPLEA